VDFIRQTQAGPQAGAQDLHGATDVKVYFCDPHSPWQRGTNENTNLLLRQYFPRGTDLSAYPQTQFDRVALRLNQRPRKSLVSDARE
jgi:IS30 family transposase